ncbi:IS1380 family transposase [Streptomyces sp. NBC_01221]|uniref:IS1380 family transposase n=1 Tax=unclassified Streptomyces TaxID=2593676 RepID=UPI00225A5780|nr:MULTISPECIES: IS1380 family transposase [unclassified Streptomyces]MCX4785460.1 IS1380 family transposase [Streptomyces sp. NBC_01221]MCX4788279.1 IS1380 family transposase [Streptomyces sp. NBC_01221]MCX4791297.1 IS1380 family transposase [Streptomyces sp. NBC_01221]MCX4794478.1 IS1380 family transposase [Streptomyces sp. NBC_01242]WSJ35822.1 IS1380 family transposase [Streptomyces sp. NBC_01321]
MQVSHTPAAVSAAFDDPNLVAHAGLVPVMRLAERCGLSGLVTQKVKLSGTRNGAGASADAKVSSIVAGMAAGADSIDDLHILRHGAMLALFRGVRAPSTLGTFLRSFTHGHALQLHAVHRRFLGQLAAHAPLLPGAGDKAFIDVDSTHKRVYGRAKQGAEYGRFKGIRTLHPLLATICTLHSRPVIATVRMRRGKAADSRGAPKFVSEALATAVEAGCTGTRILRADSQFYNAGVISACRRAGAHFSITCGMNPSIKRAVLGIPDQAWQQITYPTAVPDPATGELISDAEVAEIPAYTAFASRTKAERVTARLIVRRVRDLAKPAVVGEQGELFPVWRYHPFFTDQPAQTLQAEREHRHHAVIEQVIADSKASALAHLPSAHFHANAAWLTLWAMTYNLLRATGAQASAFHARATTATIRTHLVHVPARIAHSARRITLHLPHNWPWQHAWTHLFSTAHGPAG